MKDNLNLIIPIVTDIKNKLLTSGSFPNEWKGALIKPLLKKKGLPLEPQSYRPVYNLPFLSKVLEKAALSQITNHVDIHNLLPQY